VYPTAVAVVVAFMLGGTAAGAQDAPRTVVTPFVGMGSDGASPVSAAIMFPVTPALSVETDVAYRRGEGHLPAPSTNASLLVAFPRARRWTPYGAIGVGLARYGEAVLFRPVNGDVQLGTVSRLATTVNVGGGVTTRVTNRWDFRTDVRWFQPSGGHSDQFRVALGVGVHVGKR